MGADTPVPGMTRGTPPDEFQNTSGSMVSRGSHGARHVEPAAGRALRIVAGAQARILERLQRLRDGEEAELVDLRQVLDPRRATEEVVEVQARETAIPHLHPSHSADLEPFRLGGVHA